MDYKIIHMEKTYKLENMIENEYGSIAVLKDDEKELYCYCTERKSETLKQYVGKSIKAYLSTLAGSERYLLQNYEGGL